MGARKANAAPGPVRRIAQGAPRRFGERRCWTGRPVLVGAPSGPETPRPLPFQTRSAAMTDAAPTPDTAADANTAPQGEPAGPGFRILAQFVKDLSFENPKAPDSLRIEGKPAIDLGVEMNAQGRKDGLFEVELRLTVKASTDAMTVFNVELVYGGLFALSGVAEQDIEPLLLIECPRYLFPFAREIIARATSDGGFYPPFMLDPIDFAGIYMARQQQIARGPAETAQA